MCVCVYQVGRTQALRPLCSLRTGFHARLFFRLADRWRIARCLCVHAAGFKPQQQLHRPATSSMMRITPPRFSSCKNGQTLLKLPDCVCVCSIALGYACHSQGLYVYGPVYVVRCFEDCFEVWQFHRFHLGLQPSPCCRFYLVTNEQ